VPQGLLHSVVHIPQFNHNPMLIFHSNYNPSHTPLLAILWSFGVYGFSVHVMYTPWHITMWNMGPFGSSTSRDFNLPLLNKQLHHLEKELDFLKETRAKHNEAK
jgi:hypothetical protein